MPSSEGSPVRYLTVRQVCDHLNISRSTFWRWLRAGYLPSLVRLGPKVVRVRQHDLTAFEERLAREGGAR